MCERWGSKEVSISEFINCCRNSIGLTQIWINDMISTRELLNLHLVKHKGKSEKPGKLYLMLQYAVTHAVPSRAGDCRRDNIPWNRILLHKQMHMCSAPCQVCSHSLCPSSRLLCAVSATSRVWEQTVSKWADKATRADTCWTHSQPASWPALTIMCRSRTGSPPVPLPCWQLLFFSKTPIIPQLSGFDTLPSAQRSQLHGS